MVRHDSADIPETTEKEWVPFPGGELEGQRPKVMCPVCRRRAFRASAFARATADWSASPEGRAPGPEPVCFQCYRVDQARQRALRAARDFCAASEARFQETLPFEPVNRARLDRLRTERTAVRAGLNIGTGRFVDKRRQAQIAARHALDRIAAGLKAQGVAEPIRHPAIGEAIHAAELQLPAAWLPFVVSR